MVIDKLAEFSDAQAITVSAASTNSYDLGAPGVAQYNQIQLVRNLGKGMVSPLMCQVVEDFAGGTSLDIALQSDDNSAFSSPKDVFKMNVLLADLVAGYQLPMDKLPREIKERYIRLYYTVNGGPMTAGKISAGIVAAVDGAYKG